MDVDPSPSEVPETILGLRHALFERDQEIIALRDEIAHLRSLQSRQQSIQGAREFTVASHVLVISGPWDLHHVEKVPLEHILLQSASRTYHGEADTPALAGGPKGFDWSNAQPAGGLLSRESSLSTDVITTPTDSPVYPVRPSQVNVSKRAQPPPISVRPRLDPNAIMSRSTLDTFQKMWSQGMSPTAPMTAEAVKSYIGHSFMKNEFVHEPKDREGFGRALLHLCTLVEPILMSGGKHVDLNSPCYVFGDIHGNLEDLVKFTQNLINFWDLNYTPYSFLFLGDYVDRGPFSVECIAYLFALLALSPRNITLLRGNHEDKLVNGDVSLYSTTAFKFQCEALFGSILGIEVWNKVNYIFTLLPLSAAIDQSIFCAHGGIPRVPKYVAAETQRSGLDPRLALLRDPHFPCFESFFESPEPYEDPYITSCRQLALDMSWADPSEDEIFLDKDGFGMNPRGQGIILFGVKAVDSFFSSTGYTYVFRAHQEKADGIKVSKNARVVTIFSTSDYCEHQNCAGVVYVGNGKIRMIMKTAF